MEVVVTRDTDGTFKVWNEENEVYYAQGVECWFDNKTGMLFASKSFEEFEYFMSFHHTWPDKPFEEYGAKAKWRVQFEAMSIEKEE